MGSGNKILELLRGIPEPTADNSILRLTQMMRAAEAEGIDLLDVQKADTAYHAQLLVSEIVEQHYGKQDLTSDEFFRSYYRRPNHDRDLPYIVTELIPAGCFTSEAKREVVLHGYSIPEFPVGNAGVDAWLQTFWSTGWVSDAGGPRPSQPLKLYRGGAEYEVETGFGMSWTRSVGVARWFAFRLGKSGRAMWSAVVGPEAMLAEFSGRGEAEIVLDPELIADVRKLTEEDTDGK